MMSFLREIFLPTKYKHYFLFSYRFLGLTWSKEVATGVKILAKGNARSVSGVATHKIEISTEKENTENTAEAVSLVVKELSFGDDIIFVLNNQGIIFKELTVPFTDPERIRAILPFEIEGLIPFSKESATIEFIQTYVDTQNKSSQLCVAVVPGVQLNGIKNIFAKTSFVPTWGTIRALLIAGMYKDTGLLVADEQVLLDFENDHCTVLVFFQKQLRLVRVLSHSISSIAFAISELTKQSVSEIRSILFQSRDILPEAVQETYTQGMKKVLSDVLFTVRSVIQAPQSLRLTLFCQDGQADTLSMLFAKGLSAQEEQLSLPQIVAALGVTGGQKIQHQHFIAFLAALPTKSTENINVFRGQEQKEAKRLLLRQIATSGVVLIVLLTLLFFSYRNSLNVLHQELQSSEKEVIQMLRSEFDIPAEEKRFDDVLEYAKSEARKQEQTWLAFSSQARTSILQYLLELTERINQEALDFVLEKLTIDQSKIVIKAEVRDYEALKILERELRQSKLFIYVEPQDNPRFTMTINLVPLGEQE
jgi:hypothetical protein